MVDGGIFQRMAALKRAYADIILNTAKESAARILASEGKVLQLQRSLSLTKEDSLAMLLRLKAIMDSKVMVLASLLFRTPNFGRYVWGFTS